MTKAIKGFNADMTCLGYQFEIGGEYKHEGEVKACKSGFHVITGHPLDVFRYYAPAKSRFCVVEIDGATDSDDDHKTAAEILRVGNEIGLRELTLEAVEWVTSRAKHEGEVAKGDNGLATASGYQGAATASGYQGAATASGGRGAATASGYQGAATASGYKGAATASGGCGAATASGDYGAATASGDYGAATATGWRGCVKAREGGALFAVERDDNGAITSVACGIAGRDGIEADTWYSCVEGKLVKS